jgi:hypothetical protein
MQQPLATELRTILRAVKIISPQSLSFAGEISSVSETQREDSSEMNEQSLMVQHLGRKLYLNCYCRKFDGSTHGDLISSPNVQFLKELSSANTSRERLDRGWCVLAQLPTGHYIAEKSGFTRTLFAGEFISHSDFRRPPQDGDAISIFAPRESKTMHPGFYYIFGETIGDEQDDRELLRFYWNVTPEGATSLVRLVTERLNRFQLPFRLKVVNNPAAFNRSDAAVLYLSKRFFRIAAELLDDIHQQIADKLEAHTPLFSKTLALGLGLAEEPTTGESFGQQRSRILAEAIWNAYDLGLEDEEKRLAQIAKQFEVCGMNIQFPYLNPGSTQDYEFRFHNS